MLQFDYESSALRAATVASPTAERPSVIRQALMRIIRVNRTALVSGFLAPWLLACGVESPSPEQIGCGPYERVGAVSVVDDSGDSEWQCLPCTEDTSRRWDYLNPATGRTFGWCLPVASTESWRREMLIRAFSKSDVSNWLESDPLESSD